MQRQGKPASKDDSGTSNNIKWWILAGVLTFLSVCTFIGITLWLGLNFGDINERTLVNNKESADQETTSARLDKKQQVVFGASNQKNNEETTRRSQRDGKNGEKIKKEENVAAITTTTMGHPHSKENIEEAVVEEISKESEMVTIISKQSQPSGSPLYPQPIPETPPFVPIAPAEDPKISTQATNSVSITKIPDTKSNSTLTQTLATTVSEPVTIATPGIITIKGSDVVHEASNKQEETTDYLNSFLSSPKPKHEFGEPHGDVVDGYFGEDDKDIRKFEISDVINEKGEHFMPQSFEYPQDRQPPGSEPYQYPQIRSEPLIRHSGEIFEDGVNRDGLTSLDPESLFYTPGDPERYDGEDPDLAENPFTSFLQNKLQDLYSWLSTDEDLSGNQKSVNGDNSSMSGDLMTLLVALNQSMNAGNSSILLGKLKEMYYNESNINVTDPALLHNSSSLVSFGLLAFDLLLLRNVQQIAWEEEKVSSEEMMKDPEVLALNALFMSPEKVREFQEPSSRVGKENKEEGENKNLFQEVMEFLIGSFWAVVNLGRAYRHSVTASSDISRSSSGNTLDCIWTLYCRNLDKIAHMQGPYGFLAKMNSLGLRLVMGEFPVENALDQILREVTQGWSHMDCEKLFPRCTVTEATEVVLKTALGTSGDSEESTV